MNLHGIDKWDSMEPNLPTVEVSIGIHGAT